VDTVIALQRTSGNQAVGRALQRPQSVPAPFAAALTADGGLAGIGGPMGVDERRLDAAPVAPLRSVSAAGAAPAPEAPPEPPVEPPTPPERRRRRRRPRAAGAAHWLERIRAALERARESDARAYAHLREARDRRAHEGGR
jgi:hypothetical protein